MTATASAPAREHGSRVVRGDATDSDEGHRDFRSHPADQLRPDQLKPRLAVVVGYMLPTAT